MSKHKNIKDIVDGKIDPNQSMRLLNDLDQKDITDFLKDEDNERSFKRYKENVSVEPVNTIPEHLIDSMWTSIMGKSRKPQSIYHHTVKNILSALRSFINKAWPDRGMTLAAFAVSMVMVVSLTYFYTDTSDKSRLYTGMKGLLSPEGTLEYAMVDESGILSRPDRVVTENDVIAFRLTIKQSGYFSIGILHNQTFDWPVSNRWLEQGVYDMKEAYVLDGNRGDNNLILVSSSQVIALEMLSDKFSKIKDSKGPVRISLGDSSLALTCLKISVQEK